MSNDQPLDGRLLPVIYSYGGRSATPKSNSPVDSVDILLNSHSSRKCQLVYWHIQSNQISDGLTGVANLSSEGSRQKVQVDPLPLRPLPNLKMEWSHTPAFAEPHPAGVRCYYADKGTANGDCLCHGHFEPCVSQLLDYYGMAAHLLD